eukprot:6376748-Alexandrium_andersonii.AAC.1
MHDVLLDVLETSHKPRLWECILECLQQPGDPVQVGSRHMGWEVEAARVLEEADARVEQGGGNVRASLHGKGVSEGDEGHLPGALLE